MECTLQNLKQKITYEAEERATNADGCRRVSVGVSVQQYSIQCKWYNLIGVTTMEVNTTRGTTALVYWQLNSSLYKGAVQGYWSTPNWSDRRQGCRQVSTIRCRIVPYSDWTQLSWLICAGWWLYGTGTVQLDHQPVWARFLSSLYGGRLLQDLVNSPGKFNWTVAKTLKLAFYYSRCGVP
jgi:hypothetical protein